MTPPLEVILRRRHSARTGVRVLVLLCLLRALWMLSEELTAGAFPLALGGVSQVLIDNAMAIGLWIGAAATLMLFEKRLTTWLVPMPTPDHLCPHCGYSLKNLKSPICPECGTDIAPRLRIPPIPRS